MIRFIFFISASFLYFSVNAQITITNKLVKDSLKSRIDAIHTKIYKAIESGKLKIYNYDGREIEPSTVLTSCGSTDSIDCDSSKVSINEFQNFTFNYLKKFDFETMNTTLRIESLSVGYRVYFAGVELFGVSPYRFKYEDLVNILDDRDITFLKYLSLSYNDLYYYRREDSITTDDGWRTKAQIIAFDDDFTFDEAQRNKQSLDTGYSYRITFDSIELEIVSKILFYQFEKSNFKWHPFDVFKDFRLRNKIETSVFLTDLFYKETEPYSLGYRWGFNHNECHIRKLESNKEFIKIEFIQFPDYDSTNPAHKVWTDDMKQQPSYTYYLKPEYLQDFLGRFQYLFLKNLFVF